MKLEQLLHTVLEFAARPQQGEACLFELLFDTQKYPWYVSCEYRVASKPWATEISISLFSPRSGHPDFMFAINCLL